MGFITSGVVCKDSTEPSNGSMGRPQDHQKRLRPEQLSDYSALAFGGVPCGSQPSKCQICLIDIIWSSGVPNMLAVSLHPNLPQDSQPGNFLR